MALIITKTEAIPRKRIFRRNIAEQFADHIKFSEVPKLTPFKIQIDSQDESVIKYVMKYTNNRLISLITREVFVYDKYHKRFQKDNTSTGFFQIFGWEEISVSLEIED